MKREETAMFGTHVVVVDISICSAREILFHKHAYIYIQKKVQTLQEMKQKKTNMKQLMKRQTRSRQPRR